MALNDTLLNIAAEAMVAAADYMSLHSSEPDGTGSNETDADRMPITWEAASGGDLVCTTPMLFEGGTPSGDVTHAGFWSADTGGTFYGAYPVTGDDKFSSSGEYTVTGITIPGSSS